MTVELFSSPQLLLSGPGVALIGLLPLPLTLQPEFCGFVWVLSFELLVLEELFGALEVEVDVAFVSVVFPEEVDVGFAVVVCVPPVLVEVDVFVPPVLVEVGLAVALPPLLVVVCVGFELEVAESSPWVCVLPATVPVVDELELPLPVVEESEVELPLLPSLLELDADPEAELPLPVVDEFEFPESFVDELELPLF